MWIHYALLLRFVIVRRCRRCAKALPGMGLVTLLVDCTDLLQHTMTSPWNECISSDVSGEGM
jgi:hypothetical protein